MKHARPTVLYAGALLDATGVKASPGAVLVQDGRIVETGEADLALHLEEHGYDWLREKNGSAPA